MGSLLKGAFRKESHAHRGRCADSRTARDIVGQDFDRRLYILRRVFEHQDTDAYICSLSGRT